MSASCTEASAPPKEDKAPKVETKEVKPAAPANPSGWFHAVVKVPMGPDIPFFLYLPGEKDTEPAAIVNGTEKIKVRPTWSAGGALRLDFSVFPAHIEAKLTKDGGLEGEWKSMNPFFARMDLALSAKPVPSHDQALRFPKVDDAGEPGQFAGKWRLKFEKSVESDMIVEQNGEIAMGTVLPKAQGDWRYMAGNVRGNTLRVSAFDGIHAYFVEAKLLEGGKQIRGEFLWGDKWIESFTGERVEKLAESTALKTVKVKKGSKGLSIPELKQEPFVGKGVIVEIFATWCPNCNDAAPFLVELYDEYHDKGLEILGLNLELTPDAAHTKNQLARFEKQHGIKWPVIMRPGSGDDLPKLIPPELQGVDSFPTTVFIDRKGKVRAVYAGFSGPATGEVHEQTKAEWKRLVNEIIAN